MKIIKTQEKNLSENYIELHYSRIDQETEDILSRINPSMEYVEGRQDSQTLSVRVSDIFYWEVVDRKTFAYTEQDCLEVKITLNEILTKYANAGFLRISKSMVVNVHKIRKLKGDMNMRVAVILDNDEKIIMNRGYRSEFFKELKKLHRQEVKEN